MTVVDADARLRKLRMRSWRRGMKEMDLILGPFSDMGLSALDPAQLDLYEALLAENDQELYLWVTGAGERPLQYAQLLDRIATAVGLPPRPVPR